MDVLRDFLERAMEDSTSVRATSAADRAGQYIDKEVAPIGRSLMFMAKVPGIVAGSARYRTVDGSLLGFVEIGGRHYPEYTYVLDGVEVRKVDDDIPLEELVDEAMVMRMLHRRYPRDVTVRVSRRDPHESHCEYL